MGQPASPTVDFLYEAAGLVSPDVARPGVIAISVVSFLIAVWVLTWPFFFWRAGRRRIEGVLATMPVLPGFVTLTGKVAYGSDANVAVRLDITQEGTEEKDSGQWTQLWKETSRKITVAPFELELDDGKRVRVEPTRNVVFTDAFDKRVLVNHTTRIRIAELEPGERIWVDGELVPSLDTGRPTGYRRSGTELVLKDSPRYRMRISSERLDAPHDKSAHWWLLVGLACLLGSVIIQVSFTAYYLRTWIGDTVDATVIGRRVTGGESDEYLVDVRLADGTTTSVGVEEEHYGGFVEGMPMVVRRVRGIRWFAQAGARATVDWDHLVGIGLLVAVTAVGVIVGRWAPWHELDKGFDEREQGRLGS